MNVRGGERRGGERRTIRRMYNCCWLASGVVFLSHERCRGISSFWHTTIFLIHFPLKKSPQSYEMSQKVQYCMYRVYCLCGLCGII